MTIKWPETRKQAMESRQGKILYQIVANNFEHGLNMSNPRVRKAMDAGPCVLGSELWIEVLVTELLRGEI